MKALPLFYVNEVQSKLESINQVLECINQVLESINQVVSVKVFYLLLYSQAHRTPLLSSFTIFLLVC